MAKTKTITKCTNVDSFCAAYTQGESYSCPGHTNKVSSSASPKYGGTTPPFSDYRCYQVRVEPITTVTTPESRNIIHNQNINTLRQRLQEEILMRRQHSLYANMTLDSLGNNINSGDAIDHSQQNLVFNIISQLVNVINGINAKAEDGQHNAPPAEIKVGGGDKIRATDLKGYPEGERIASLEQYLTSVLNDCICYSDCTDHMSTTIRKLTCSCVRQCGCVY